MIKSKEKKNKKKLRTEKKKTPLLALSMHIVFSSASLLTRRIFSELEIFDI